MADELEPIAETELPDTEAAIEPEAEAEDLPELPVDVSDDAETDGEGDDDTEADGDGEGEPEPPEYVTITGDDGKEYQVPKEIEGMFLKNKDYTQKSQVNSAKAKELEEREQQLNQQFEASEVELESRATLKSVTAQIEEYSKLTQEDWDAHHSQDPMGTEKHWRNFHFLQSQKAELEGKISKAEAERTEKAQQDLAKRVQETNEFAAKNIPGFKPELTDKLIAFAGEMGVPEAALKSNWSPTFYKLLHRAYVGDASLKKQSAARKPAPAPIAPLTTVTPKAPNAGRRSLSDLAKSGDLEAYAAARRAGRS